MSVEPRPPSRPSAEADASKSIRPHELTWFVLLAKWVEFAQSAVALPAEGAEGRFKQSVPDIIGLQAVWFALGEVDDLPVDERALGINRAAVLIEQHLESLQKRYRDTPMPEGLQELVAEATARLDAARLNP